MSLCWSVLEDEESGTNKSQCYGVSFLCGGFAFVLVSVVSAGASLLCCCHARAGVMCMRRELK